MFYCDFHDLEKRFEKGDLKLFVQRVVDFVLDYGLAMMDDLLVYHYEYILQLKLKEGVRVR